jgi:putative redox protein
MEARIKWIEGAAWMAESASGHAIVIDGSPEIGGRNLGARPMELVLMGLGSCSAMDVMLILKKSRQDMQDCQIEIQAERADTDPKVFTKIHLHYIISGHNLNPKHVKRAVDLSTETYCSVSQMLNKTAVISHDYEIQDNT